MRSIPVDKELVAYCGLYCGACRSYAIGRCPGCRKTDVTWCKVRTCCINHEYATCAACTQCHEPGECPQYQTILSRLIGFIFRTSRAKCVHRIRAVGQLAFAEEMATRGRHSLPR